MLNNSESTSPSNSPEGHWPKLDYQDIGKSPYELLTKYLGVRELETVVGFTIGSQEAYYWVCMYPNFVKAAVSTCGSAKTIPHNRAFLEGHKAALISSIDYEDGVYSAEDIDPVRGLGIFGRAYCAWAMSVTWFQEKL